MPGLPDADGTDGPAIALALPGAGEARAAKRGFEVATFRSLRHVDFRNLWMSTVTASAAQWIQQVTVGWVAYEMTGSPLFVGMANGLRSLPLLVLGPLGGVAADRVERKKLMMSTQICLIITSVIFALLLATGHANIWLLFLFTFTTGIAWAFNMPVRQSVVSNVVPREDLMNAVALNSAGNNVTRILGPSIGGLLIAYLGSANNFFLQSAIYVIVTLLILRLRIPAQVKRQETASVLADLREGIKYTWRHPTLRPQMILALVPMLIAFPMNSLLPIFAGDVLEVGVGGYGLMMGAPGIGAVIGTLTVASIRNVERKGLLILGAVALQGVCLILLSQTRLLPLSLLCLMFYGAAQMSYMTTNQSVIQLTAPEEIRGRVQGLYMLNQGLIPFGSLMAGTLASFTSVPFTYLVMGIATVVFATGFIVRSSSLRGL